MINELQNNRLLNPFVFASDFKANIHLLDIDFLPIQMNDGVKLIQVLEGEATVKISFNHYRLAAGDFLLINAFEAHSIEKVCGHNKILILEFGESFLENKLFAFDIEFYRNFNTEIVGKIKDLMLKIYKNSDKENGIKDEAKELVYETARLCDSYFQIHEYSKTREALSPYYNHPINKDRMKQAYEYFYLNVEDTKRLDALSEMMSIDKSYASRLIKAGMGIPFQETMNIVRVDRAEILLLGTDMSIQAISDMLNFSTPYYFNKIFKHHFGLSPNDHRRKFKKLTFPLASAIVKNAFLPGEKSSSFMEADGKRFIYDSEQKLLTVTDLSGKVLLKTTI